MIERAIESWLTKTNERNYQAAFCQVLLHQGHRVLHSSSHGPMEQGKDIITIGPDGNYHAYQTKTGDIGLSDWRGIAGEIQELVELPIDYPGVDKARGHRAYLVANGKISDPVRNQISDRNEDNLRKQRQYAPLEVIGLDSLLKMFIDAQGRFVPRELPDMRTFLELYLQDGRTMLPKQRLFATLETTVFGETPKRPSDAIDAVTSSLIIVSYLLNSFEQSGNYYAMAEGWSILAASISRFAARNTVPPEAWRGSLDLVMAEMEANLAALRNDALSRIDFLEGDIRADGAGMLRARTTIVLGALACHELLPAPQFGSDRDPQKVLDLIRKHLEQRGFWGDSAFPYLFHIVRFLEQQNEAVLAERLLGECFVALVENNYREQGMIFPSPYVGAEEVLESALPDRLRDADFEGYRGSSWVLRSLLEMLVRRGRKDLVASMWAKLTYCQQNEFVPDNAEDIFTWRSENGTNRSGFPNQTQSWAGLVTESAEESTISPIYRAFLQVLPFHILVCPHRATPAVIRSLDGGL